MKTPVPAKFLVATLLVGLLAAGCGAGAESSPASSEDRLQVVASFYPLAWAAEQVGGDRVEVTDLTPQGGEAHDATLTASQRAGLEDADLVLIHGDYGFQPTIEEAVAGNDAPVLYLANDKDRNMFYDVDTNQPDMHLWLDTQIMRLFVRDLGARLGEIDPAHRAEYEQRSQALQQRLRDLGTQVKLPCTYWDVVTSHEAFNYLLPGFGNGMEPPRQIGIEGLTPEGEPSADRVQAAIDAIEGGVAPRAVFYEPTDEGRRVAEAVAADVGAEIVPLNPLESEPPEGDYLSVMQTNMDTLADWMRCR